MNTVVNKVVMVSEKRREGSFEPGGGGGVFIFFH